MHVTILALGSRGDVVPYATLGKALRAAGHRVRLATFENFASLAAGQGLDFHPIRGDVQALLNRPDGVSLSEAGRNPLKMARFVLRLFGRMAAGFAHDLTPLASSETDLIVNQVPGGMYGYDLAERLGAVMILAAVVPLTPSDHRPMVVFPSLFSCVPGYNRFTHWLAYQLVWQGYRRAINRWRREVLGLSPAPVWGYSSLMEERRVPVLNGFSGHVVDRPPDWGDHVHLTGYWFPEDRDWAPPDDLCRFMQAGPPPVFVGFGSMPIRHADRTTSVVLDALARNGQRAILHAGWGGMGQGALPETVFTIDYAPYGWLFRRMAAVVHHGGAGSTAFSHWAGVPSVVVPFLFDQFYWGRRTFELGVGPRPVPRRRLTAGRLAAAIDTAVTDDQMRRRAAALGRKVRAEAGVRTAVELIERYAAGR